MKTTWGELIAERFDQTGDTWEDLETTLTPEEMYTEFNCDYGATEGIPFTAWSKEWVYFPMMYDGSEWVGIVPRNPREFKCKHQGGG